MEHNRKVKEEFTKQSKHFNEYQSTIDKVEFTKDAIENVGFSSNDEVLEIGAGTCGFGREIAPKVQKIYEYDLTKAMLDKGKNESLKAGIINAEYIVGEAENLKFENKSFDKTVSRLAFHHFENIEKPFSEMVRVLKDSGKIVIIDIEARKEFLRNNADIIEKFRDNSHSKMISKSEIFTLAEKYNLKNVKYSSKPIELKLEDWMNLTELDESSKVIIRTKMLEDINNEKETGFEPYLKNDEIYFCHNWFLFIATK